MSVFDVVDNVAAIIADVLVVLLSIVLAAAFLIIPPLAVFVQGVCGWWMWLIFLSIPVFLLIHTCIKDIEHIVRSMIYERKNKKDTV